jgi:DNA-directed RNA polymerase subunit RPC12/RpoP
MGFSCDVCSKSFQCINLLREHVRTHTGERPYRCKVCSKGFASLSNYKTHLRTHTGERPYRCTTCGASFTTSTGLKRHSLIHSKERPYKCKYCDQSFARSSTLRTHERLHTGERPFKCQVCGKGFVASSPLKRHMLSHNKCEGCGERFFEPQQLQEHVCSKGTTGASVPTPASVSAASDHLSVDSPASASISLDGDGDGDVSLDSAASPGSALTASTAWSGRSPSDTSYGTPGSQPMSMPGFPQMPNSFPSLPSYQQPQFSSSSLPTTAAMNRQAGTSNADTEAGAPPPDMLGDLDELMDLAAPLDEFDITPLIELEGLGASYVPGQSAVSHPGHSTNCDCSRMLDTMLGAVFTASSTGRLAPISDGSSALNSNPQMMQAPSLPVQGLPSFDTLATYNVPMSLRMLETESQARVGNHYPVFPTSAPTANPSSSAASLDKYLGSIGLGSLQQLPALSAAKGQGFGQQSMSFTDLGTTGSMTNPSATLPPL